MAYGNGILVLVYPSKWFYLLVHLLCLHESVSLEEEGNKQLLGCDGWMVFQIVNQELLENNTNHHS